MKNKHLKLVVSNKKDSMSMNELQNMFGPFIVKVYDMFYTVTMDEQLNAIVMARYLSENGYNTSAVQREVGNKYFFYIWK